MKKTAKEYTPDYKYNMVMETFKGEKSIRQIANENEIPYDTLKYWRRSFLKRAVTIFEEGTDDTLSAAPNTDKDIESEAYISILRNLRKAKNLTQKQVAQYLEIPVTTYTRYESGKTTLPIDHLKKLAALYKVSTDQILGI
jgi:transposase-like protein